MTPRDPRALLALLEEVAGEIRDCAKEPGHAHAAFWARSAATNVGDACEDLYRYIRETEEG